MMMMMMMSLLLCVQGQEYVEQYRLQYQREDDGRWFTFHNRRGQQVTNERRCQRVTKLTSFRSRERCCGIH